MYASNRCQGCGARIVTEGTGVLTSPNYPHSWEEGGECDWVIVGARPCEFQVCAVIQMWVDSDSLNRDSQFIWASPWNKLIKFYFCLRIMIRNSYCSGTTTSTGIA